MLKRVGAAVMVLTGVLATAPDGEAANATAPAARSAPPAPAGPSPTTGSGNNNYAAPQVSQDAAARARMHECAHQWSAIKKAGNAGVTTWKEFSATCLVVSR